MKKAVLYNLNLLLGIMIAFFSGCKTQKPASQPVMVKYGVPREIIENEVKPVAPPDTVPAQEPEVPDIPVCKYGPPGGNW